MLWRSFNPGLKIPNFFKNEDICLLNDCREGDISDLVC
jgi:hypothetical protein